MSSNGDLQHIYIDTSYIQSFLRPKDDEERWQKKQVRTAIERAKRNGKIFIILPFIVAGELLNNLNQGDIERDIKQEIVGELFKILEDEKIDLKPAKADALKLAASIKDQDRLLGDTDLLIASQALCDIHSIHLLIHDRKIIESEKIAEVEREMPERLNELKISDSIK
ncbi:MAG: putative PIN_12 domain-containing protein [Methanothrix sp.]|jgi:predicted nucleic acid-binding protein|nr:MAG: putative PIN_12 domain-containing protein [Methanothrix sp.]